MASSKHGRHKTREEREINNIDINAIVDLIDSMDINQMSSIISSFGLKPNESLQNLDNQSSEGTENIVTVDPANSDDKKSELVNIIEDISSIDKGELLDKIVALYVVNKILKK